MCPHEEKLTAWLLGDLPPEEQQAMTRHIDACASCRCLRDELSRVLTPLRSGLEKDRGLKVKPLMRRPRKSGSPPNRWLWLAPHAWLRHAALFCIAFGALFALISVVYRHGEHQRCGDAAITHITFRREDAPVPALASVPRPSIAEKSALADFKPDAVPPAASAPAVMAPPLPAREPRMPELPRLVKAECKSDPAAEAPAEVPTRSLRPLPVVAKAKDNAKRDRSKGTASAYSRPPSDLQTKPVALAVGISAGTMLAPTNAVNTNAIPTNAAAPSAARKNP
ncbi:MAG TPA: zf-HC2 domain-containing protein [Kiritimatiellia bacterium]|nr:zf-HC2 domain-containing protein [Kiritimatiellia bacterium]HPS06557.1 zf-HC2 domain-containing protein [Kiritimatiellia bacterium]